MCNMGTHLYKTIYVTLEHKKKNMNSLYLQDLDAQTINNLRCMSSKFC